MSMRKEKTRSKCVCKEDMPAVRTRLKNYVKSRKLTGQWIGLAEALTSLRL